MPNRDQNETHRPHNLIPLTEQERRMVAERTAPSATVVHEAIRREGLNELRRPLQALAWSGLAAGLSMGLSLLAQGLLLAYLPPAPWNVLVYRLGYSLGFLVVVLGRQHLYTEDTLTPVLPLLIRRDRATLLNVLRLWGVVLAANLLGALIFALVVGLGHVFPVAVENAFSALGRDALAGSPATILLRAIFAGWLIALMVWLLPFAGNARVTVVAVMTYIVGLAGLAHIIAGSIEGLYVVVTGQYPAGRFLLYFVLPTLIGNTAGGVALVAALNSAQVTAGGHRPPDRPR